MTFPLDNFIAEAQEENHSKEYLDDIKAYVKKLSDNNLPVIFSIQHLCLLAGVNIRRIDSLCDSTRIDAYQRFKLRKKRGGYRVIRSPESELKFLQRWILNNILDQIPSHRNSKGFDKKSSIKQNAEQHLKREAILKMDLMRFYDSINEKRVYGIFKSVGYHPNLAVSFAKICTIKPDNLFICSFKKHEEGLKKRILLQDEGVLPQGSPCSPKLSNLVARRLDNRLMKLSAKHELQYSRYADDITISGNFEKLKSIKKICYRIIRDESFFVNHSKTKFLKRGSRFFVTGLSVNIEVVTIPRKFKDEIEHHLFHCIKNGVEVHLKKAGIKNRNFKDWLLGSIAYVFSIEREIGEKYFEEFKRIQWPI